VSLSVLQAIIDEAMQQVESTGVTRKELIKGIL